MECFLLGEAIRKRRLELGLTQEQLCEGICEPITISRLENGKQTPSRNRLNAILERLDMPRERYFAFLSPDENEIENLEREIILCNASFEQAPVEKRAEIRQEAFALHRKLESLLKSDDNLIRQRILRSRVLLGKEEGSYSEPEKIQLLLEAMHLTLPSFDLEHIDRGLYTMEEIKIINNLGNAYSRNGDSMQAISIFRQLFLHMKDHVKSATPARATIAMVAYNYARELGIIGRYEEAVQIAEEGRRYALTYGNYRSLASILGVLAEGYYHLGKIGESRDFYYQNYYMSKAVGELYDLPFIREDAEKYLGLVFET